MPELAEVEHARWTLEKYLQGKRVVEVLTVESGGGPRDGAFDDTVFEKTSVPDGATFETALKGSWCKEVHRKGKHLWWVMESEDANGDSDDNATSKRVRAAMHPLFHFRMTGSFVVKGVPSSKYKDFKVHDETWPPKFTKCEFVLDDGTRISFINQRRFGRICLRADPAAEPPVSKLAADPYTEMPSLEEFKKSLQASKLSLKALLMNQERVVCGLGNWMVDEVAFQARLHPETAANTLDADTIKRVHEVIVSICKTACAALQANKEFPETWLFHKRWGKGKSAKEKMQGHDIEFITVGGRTSAIVPALQRKTNGADQEGDLKAEPQTAPRPGAQAKKRASAPPKKTQTAKKAKPEPESAAPPSSKTATPRRRTTRARSSAK